jgi:pyrimidine-nucleoside phosphorylase
MLHSGAILSWRKSERPVVDKHSTGGIGDKISLILTPLLAAVGYRVLKLTGRGLGPTGGTLDKLEAIPGFRTHLELKEAQEQVERIGCVMFGATAELAPADKKLYALRDVTATVPSIPLITASIMCKKLAESPEALVLDVKFGSGAFMRELEDARALANAMVTLGKQMGVATSALLTDMNQPLGVMAGNAVEVLESIEVLRGGGPADTRELTLALASEVLLLSGKANDETSAMEMLKSVLESGAAYERFERMVSEQGGDLKGIPSCSESVEVTSKRSGFVKEMQVDQLGYAIIGLGGGRKKMGDAIDPTVGLEMLVKLGDAVEQGQPLVRIIAPPGAMRDAAEIRISAAIAIGDEPCEAPKKIVGRVG